MRIMNAPLCTRLLVADPIETPQRLSRISPPQAVHPAANHLRRPWIRKRKIELNYSVKYHSHDLYHFDDSAVPPPMGLLLRRRAPVRSVRSADAASWPIPRYY
jgi:hypothetical protein